MHLTQEEIFFLPSTKFTCSFLSMDFDVNTKCAIFMSTYLLNFKGRRMSESRIIRKVVPAVVPIDLRFMYLVAV